MLRSGRGPKGGSPTLMDSAERVTVAVLWAIAAHLRGIMPLSPIPSGITPNMRTDGVERGQTTARLRTVRSTMGQLATGYACDTCLILGVGIY